ncbi:MAG: MFS transporter [Anaerolineae bacterium]|nr:MAG: MFS transporter [Anaerolineae bacterium]
MTLLALGLGMATNTLDPALLSFKVAELAPASRNTALGLITASGLLVATLTQPIIGALSDRTRAPLGRRVPYMIVGTLLAIAFLFVVALAPTIGILLLGVLVYQFGANTAQAPWQALLPDQLPITLRGAASGLKSLFEILGFILGRRIAGYMVAQGTPQAAVLSASAVLTVTLVLTSLTARYWRGRRSPEDPDGEGQEFPTSESPGKQASGRSQGARPGISASLQRSNWPRGFGWWFVNRALFWAAVIALNSFVIFYMEDVVGMTFSEASRLFGDLSVALGVSLLIITIPAGRLSDKLGRRPMILAACLVAVAGNLLLLGARTRPVLILGGAALGLATGVFLSASWALATDLVPRAMAARYLGIANIATAGGSFLARLAGGALIDPINRLTGSQEAGYLTLYSLTLVAFVVAAFAVTRLDIGEDRRSA